MDWLILLVAVLAVVALFLAALTAIDLRTAVNEVLAELDRPDLDSADVRGHLAQVEAEIAATRALVQDTNDVTRTTALRVQQVDRKVDDVCADLAPSRK